MSYNRLTALTTSSLSLIDIHILPHQNNRDIGYPPGKTIKACRSAASQKMGGLTVEKEAPSFATLASQSLNPKIDSQTSQCHESPRAGLGIEITCQGPYIRLGMRD